MVLMRFRILVGAWGVVCGFGDLGFLGSEFSCSELGGFSSCEGFR